MAVTTQKFASRNALTMYDFDPGGTSATDVGWVDMRDYEGIHVTVFRSVGTGDISAFTLISNDQADGTGTDTTVKTHALGSAVDAVGDYIHLEVTAEEIADLDPDGRSVSASVALAVATDECVVTYVRYGSKRATADLTSDTIA